MFTRPEAGVPASTRVPKSIEWGIALAFLAAAISGLAIFLNGFAVRQVPDAGIYTTLKNGVAATVLIAAALVGGDLRTAVPAIRRHWPMVLAVGIVGGSVPFVLFFTGLAQASAPSAAFIQKTLFIWVAFLAVPFLGERLGIASIAGLAVLLVGQALVLPPDGIRWGSGETMILAATVMWAVETVLVRRLLGSIPATAMAALRLGVGLAVLVAYLVATGRFAAIAALGPSQLGWIVLTGLILAGYVAAWFASLERAPASIVTSVLVVGAVVTGVLSAISKGAVPSPAVVGGYVFIVVAAGLLTGWSIRTARSVRVALPPAGGPLQSTAS